MLASENDALPGGKVGGIGDVIRDVPAALVARGQQVSVLTPAYGRFAQLPGARRLATYQVPFGGGSESVTLYEVPGRRPEQGVRNLVIDHPLFAPGDGFGPGGHIYHDDGPDAPFATDATRFALLCVAAATALVEGQIPLPDVVHLHDWHAALFTVLAHCHPRYRELADLHTVFTIHNLALQGVRPFDGHASSLAAWFPELETGDIVLADPRWPECINPMASAIRLADIVHAVSPTYATEILRPNAVAERGFAGGEGLEADLRDANAEGRLRGILNGCEYPKRDGISRRWPDLLETLREQVLTWAAAQGEVAPAHFIANARLTRLTRRRPAVLLTSVGRLTDQKARLFREPSSSGEPAIEAILKGLGTHGLLLLLGSGAPDYERFFAEVAARHRNLLFLRGFSVELADLLYRQGDLFLMPSSFEPCGISQLLAMRDGQPCVVHGVGGLKDTVRDGETGFVFEGTSLRQQADRFVEATARAIEFKDTDADGWRRIRGSAARQRFRWADTAATYVRELYQ